MLKANLYCGLNRPRIESLINRYMTFTNELFLKRKYIVESKFLIPVNYSFNLIKIAAVST